MTVTLVPPLHSFKNDCHVYAHPLAHSPGRIPHIGSVLAVSREKKGSYSSTGAPYVRMGQTIYETVLGILRHDQPKFFCCH